MGGKFAPNKLREGRFQCKIRAGWPTCNQGPPMGCIANSAGTSREKPGVGERSKTLWSGVHRLHIGAEGGARQCGVCSYPRSPST
jgi:hypothetical protein